MNKILGCFVFVLVLGFSAAYAYAEEITSFDSKLQIRADGTVEVSETIEYDFGTAEKHGILRSLKTTHPQPAIVWYKNRSIGYTIELVTEGGHIVPYTVSNNSARLTIKIGDPDIVISGKHRYRITYLMDGALSYGSAGAELYYNVTGNEWPVRINNAHVIIGDTTGTLLGSNTACYRGVVGSIDRCSVASSSEYGYSFMTGALARGEGLTIAQSLRADNVAVRIHEEPSWVLITGTMMAVWFFGLLIWAWRYHNQYKGNLPVVAQYEPYPGVLPMYMGVLYDNRLDSKDLTAGIIYLAEQGFIKIQRLDTKVLWLFDTTDYTFTLLRPASELLDGSLYKILSIIFPSAATVGSTALLSGIKGNKMSNGLVYKSIQTELTTKLKADGFILPSLNKVTGSMILLCVLVVLLSASFHFVLGIILGVVSAVIIALAVTNRLTKLGGEARNYLKGFKLFLSVTDEERFKFFNAPDKNPEMFMKYLPYAIALGVEKEWSKVFEGMAIPNPIWYEGGDMTAFSAVAFTSDLGRFSSAFTSSSGVQGSSGGGFSGGGGGGGGGGSW